MIEAVAKAWDGVIVRTWLERRVAAAKSDQVVAERGGRDRHDDCDKATAEEMVCGLMQAKQAPETQEGFAAALRALLDRDEYIWRGVYDDTRFDRHVRAMIKKLIKMTKTNDGFANTTHYQ
ncbi:MULTISPECIES: hypothetical protein [unclassified Sphingomonas]|uniref:hypothetical protein n=1 Tax=unclassified Sphingomonas TaxID=196159 RepID=UPI00070179AA|nr:MULTISPECIES: hypothetical protein [unclassified Sphingomonas]KQN30340.1 hypothetical protein ASF00_06120 [Sphingomonas sp. Leaf34]KQN32770.1 hypothetical protein ASE88_01920 [Sphingomonas sp. Leaf38]